MSASHPAPATACGRFFAAARHSVATATGVASHNRPPLNPLQQRKWPRERSRGHQRKRRTERRRWGQKRRLRKGGAREARPENRANTGGTGKKKSQPDKGWDFTLWWRWRELNPRPKVIHPKYYMLSPSLVSYPACRRARLSVYQLVDFRRCNPSTGSAYPASMTQLLKARALSQSRLRP